MTPPTGCPAEVRVHSAGGSRGMKLLKITLLRRTCQHPCCPELAVRAGDDVEDHPPDRCGSNTAGPRSARSPRWASPSPCWPPSPPGSGTPPRRCWTWPCCATAPSPGASAVGVLLFALAGTTFGLTQYLQLVLGYSPLVAGLGTLPVAVAIGLTAPVAPQLAARVGPGAAVAAGLPLMSTGRTAMAVLTTTDSYARCSSAGCSPPSTAPTSRAMCRAAEAVGQGDKG